MQIKDITVGKFYRTKHDGLALVLDKGKLESDFSPRYSHSFDLGGIIKETVNGRWYARRQGIPGNSVAVWLVGTSRVDVILTRHVTNAVTDEGVQNFLTDYISRAEKQRIHNEESARITADREIIATALAGLVGKDPTALSSWDLNNPWRIVTENETFVKKATMLYLKVLAMKGEDVAGIPAADLIDDLRSATEAVKDSKRRLEARTQGAQSVCAQQVTGVNLKVTITDTSTKAVANA